MDLVIKAVKNFAKIQEFYLRVIKRVKLFYLYYKFFIKKSNIVGKFHNTTLLSLHDRGQVDLAPKVPNTWVIFDLDYLYEMIIV